MDKKAYLQPVHRTLLEHGNAQLGLFAGEDRRIASIASRFMADERVDPIYTHPGLCLTVLPHREIPSGLVWERQTGYATLLVHPLQGRDGRMRGVPFGTKARLMLIFLMTEAVRTRSRHVELGRSMRAWLTTMGVAVNGTNYATVADQADRIEHSMLSFHLCGQDGEAALRDSIIRGSFRGFGDKTGHTVELSEGFIKQLLNGQFQLQKEQSSCLQTRACHLTCTFGLRIAFTCLRSQPKFPGNPCSCSLVPARSC